MKNMTSEQLRALYLDYFAKNGHAVIQSASLIPENDPTVLFTTAGMHPLVPYLLGAKHPMGTRLVNVQKCVRTGDIDEVGDASHLTFFEMLGNWSLGDYFKQEAIAFSWEFLTGAEYLAIDPDKLAVSVFAGEEGIERDDESYAIWRKMGVPAERIFFLPRANNWWGPAGLTGPCGPDTEMFIVREKEPCGPDCSPACDCGRYLEIWNDVFMQYNKTADGTYEPLAQKNVDTGMGLERTIGVLQGVQTVYETDLFAPILQCIELLCGKPYGVCPVVTRAMRIVADHLRTATFILGDERGVTPGNVDQSYVLRRLIRRATRFATMDLGIPENRLQEIIGVICEKYQDVYPELHTRRAYIEEQLTLEIKRFLGTIHQGMREFEKLMARLRRLEEQFEVLKDSIAGKNTDAIAESIRHLRAGIRPLGGTEAVSAVLDRIEASPDSVSPHQIDSLKGSYWRIDGLTAFHLYDTFGFPVELTQELAREKGIDVDMDAFAREFAAHQERSKAGSDVRFAGGLADATQTTARLHTATHLLLASLRRVLGNDVFQKGSNITPERLRFDFNFPRKVTPEELEQIEQNVNDAIAHKLPVTCEEMTVDAAHQSGALGVFGERYGERVRVYSAGDVSREICGGPHAGNTGELGTFRIQKEESSSSGVRRIRAVLE
jgi:alanyl-tRNA synthetase